MQQIIIVEDDQIIREELQIFLSKYGYDIPKEEKVYLAVYIKRIQPHIEI